MLGGLSFDTLLTGPALAQPASFALKALHYDLNGSDVEQLFAVFERATPRHS
jgi:hypothetical protein